MQIFLRAHRQHADAVDPVHTAVRNCTVCGTRAYGCLIEVKIFWPWTKAINQLLKMGVRAEQQALAKWGLNFVIDEYLPAKLKKVSQFLP